MPPVNRYVKELVQDEVYNAIDAGTNTSSVTIYKDSQYGQREQMDPAQRPAVVVYAPTEVESESLTPDGNVRSVFRLDVLIWSVEEHGTTHNADTAELINKIRISLANYAGSGADAIGIPQNGITIVEDAAVVMGQDEAWLLGLSIPAHYCLATIISV